MARAAAADERIGIAIESSYDGTGIRAARDDTGALGRSTRSTAVEIDKIPTKARGAANALSALAFAAANGGGNARGLAIAAGSAADSVAHLSSSARIAASAAGIGALVTVVGVIIGLLTEMEARAKSAGDALGKSLGDFTDQALKARAQAVEGQFALAQERLAKLQKGGGIFGIDVNLPAIARANAEVIKLAAEREAIFAAQLDRRRTKGRSAAEEAKQREEADTKRSKALLDDITTSYKELYDKRTQSADGAARLKVQREYSERRDEIDALKVHEDVKTQLIAAAARDRAEKLTNIHLESAARQNAIEDKLFREQQDRYDRTFAMVQQTAERALDAAITGSESYISAVTKTLLTPLVHKLEAIAVEQGIDALASAAFLDFVGAARHAAVAAAAVAGAQKVAQIAGLTSGGGGSRGGGFGPSFSSRDPREASNNVTVVIQTVNPFSNEIIGETSYQLQRAGVLKRPVYAPPVSSVRAA